MPREKGKTILLVEDDPIIALAERKILERQGYTVITARTGEDAIEVVRTTDGIDLILMDINLGPGIDGTEAAEIILAREEIPLVFLSSHTEPEVVAKTEGITSYGYVVKNSGETVLMASIKMAFRLFAAREREREARAQLRRQNEFLRFYRVAVDGMSDYRIAVTDREYRYRIVSRHYLENYNLTEEEILGKTVAQVMGEDVFRKFIKPRTDLALSGQRVETSRWFDHPARGMGRRYINVMYYPIFDELPGDRREVSAVAVVVRDVTREKEADKALKKSEERFRTLADDLPAMICEYLPDSTLTYVNRAYCEYHGMKREEMVGTQFLRFIPPENREAAQQTYLALTPDRPLNTHTQYVIRNGEVRWQEWRDRAFFNREGKAVRFQAIGIDITERKRAEEAATRLAEWRETMMKEVQHRIKNTMNTMVSMLSLQADTLEDPGAATALNDARSRFQSMGVLYDQLYRTERHDAGSVGTYLETLVRAIVDLFPDGETVTTMFGIEDFELDAKRLSTLGMIVNELVTNAMKYAFRDRDDRRLSVAVRCAGEVTVIVEDNGPGLPEEFQIDTQESFGLTMVRELADQLNGTVRYERKGGARFVLEFPL